MEEKNTPGPDRNPITKEKPKKITPQKVNLDDIPEKKPQVIFVDGDPKDYEIIKS